MALARFEPASNLVGRKAFGGGSFFNFNLVPCSLPTYLNFLDHLNYVRRTSIEFVLMMEEFRPVVFAFISAALAFPAPTHKVFHAYVVVLHSMPRVLQLVAVLTLSTGRLVEMAELEAVGLIVYVPAPTPMHADVRKLVFMVRGLVMAEERMRAQWVGGQSMLWERWSWW